MSLDLKIEINHKYQYNETLYNLIKSEVINIEEASRMYNIILMLDYYFILYNKNNIIAELSISKKDNNIYQIDDVLVKEEYRGNNYAGLLLMNTLLYFEELNKNILINIFCSYDNKIAYKCYEKIFGNPYKINNNYAYFSYQL